MRRLVCAVTLSIGMLMGCGGPADVNTPDTVDSVEQGLACQYPDMLCPSRYACVGGLCRKECPETEVCWNGAACRIYADGTPYCF
ncbi:hypothetical protein [Pyxidicoccus caerfyrddinensis]|uniref:hypothetical protein n=1 Tax=Pyxidicoccus caerfyrddinensis TaxID=2709663 RepID=UPI0013DD58D6|nr:hypothetical protein [Pyxidicoccus caerfyrddinensis]